MENHKQEKPQEEQRDSLITQAVKWSAVFS